MFYPLKVVQVQQSACAVAGLPLWKRPPWLLNRRFGRLLLLLLLYGGILPAQTYLIRPERLFDGERMQTGWGVIVSADTIQAAGPLSGLALPPGVITLDQANATLLPGLIEGHAHLLLHPYNETSWNDQVLTESIAERVARGVVHAERTLAAGFTTVRDLGSEGAGYADVGLQQAIRKGIVPGPRLLVAGPAIVATGSYGPKGFADHVRVPIGAQEADGYDALSRVVREQIGGGADLIKVYADYRWGPDRQAMPTFTLEELKLIVAIAHSSGRPVVAHAATAEGMRRATLAGVSTIEHGDGGTPEVFRLMRERGVAFCPTLAAGDAILQYQGWQKDREPAPERIRQKRASFQAALAAGVTIVAGGDVGVFPHGDNVRELEMMVDYGMMPLAVLQAVTAGNASVFGLADRLGRIRPGQQADLLLVGGNPAENISDLRQVIWVMQAGKMVSSRSRAVAE